MVADTKPQQRKKEESEQLRGWRDKIKFMNIVNISQYRLSCEMSRDRTYNPCAMP